MSQNWLLVAIWLLPLYMLWYKIDLVKAELIKKCAKWRKLNQTFILALTLSFYIALYIQLFGHTQVIPTPKAWKRLCWKICLFMSVYIPFMPCLISKISGNISMLLSIPLNLSAESFSLWRGRFKGFLNRGHLEWFCQEKTSIKINSKTASQIARICWPTVGQIQQGILWNKVLS